MALKPTICAISVILSLDIIFLVNRFTSPLIAVSVRFLFMVFTHVNYSFSPLAFSNETLKLLLKDFQTSSSVGIKVVRDGTKRMVNIGFFIRRLEFTFRGSNTDIIFKKKKKKMPTSRSDGVLAKRAYIDGVGASLGPCKGERNPLCAACDPLLNINFSKTIF